MRKEIQKGGSQAEELTSNSVELSLTGSSTQWEGGSPGNPPWEFSMGALHGVGSGSPGCQGVLQGGTSPGGSPQAGVLLGSSMGSSMWGFSTGSFLGVLHGCLHGFSGRLCRTCFRAVLQRSKETSGIYKPIPFSYCLKVEYINTLAIAVCPQCG